MAVGVIPTFHLGLRALISDPDSIVNYVVRHVLMNPGSITSLHAEDEVSVRKIDGDYPNKGVGIANHFRDRVQSILDRYATDNNKFLVATEVVDNGDDTSITVKLSIKATWNDRIISYDREFLIEQTKDFREMLMDTNRVPEKVETAQTGNFTGTIGYVPHPNNNDRN